MIYKISDGIDFGYLKGIRFQFVGCANLEYLVACIKYMDLAFHPNSFALLLAKTSFWEIKALHEAYRNNIRSLICLNIDKQIEFWKKESIRRGEEIEVDDEPNNAQSDFVKNEIVENIRGPKFDIEKHRQLEAEYIQISNSNFDRYVPEKIEDIKLDDFRIPIKLALRALENEKNIIEFIKDELAKPISEMSWPKLNCDIESECNFYILIKYLRLLIGYRRTIRNNKYNNSITEKWNCEICDGDEETGCLYNDPSECPNEK